MVTFVVVWGLTAILSAVTAGIVASLKRRDHSFWAAWTFLFPPMLIVLLLMSRNRGPVPHRPSPDDDQDRAEV